MTGCRRGSRDWRSVRPRSRSCWCRSPVVSSAMSRTRRSRERRRCSTGRCPTGTSRRGTWCTATRIRCSRTSAYVPGAVVAPGARRVRQPRRRAVGRDRVRAGRGGRAGDVVGGRRRRRRAGVARVPAGDDRDFERLERRRGGGAGGRRAGAGVDRRADRGRVGQARAARAGAAVGRSSGASRPGTGRCGGGDRRVGGRPCVAGWVRWIRRPVPRPVVPGRARLAAFPVVGDRRRGRRPGRVPGCGDRRHRRRLGARLAATAPWPRTHAAWPPSARRFCSRVQLAANYWSYTYLAWAFPLLALALLTPSRPPAPSA